MYIRPQYIFRRFSFQSKIWRTLVILTDCNSHHLVAMRTLLSYPLTHGRRGGVRRLSCVSRRSRLHALTHPTPDLSQSQTVASNNRRAEHSTGEHCASHRCNANWLFVSLDARSPQLHSDETCCCGRASAQLDDAVVNNTTELLATLVQLGFSE